jgi:hypothetical protein
MQKLQSAYFVGNVPMPPDNAASEKIPSILDPEWPQPEGAAGEAS